ncbi:MAG: energy transducer TonB [Campylobacterota bacterium]|nr:energy transducer TonB [Campylobacterota bacterium]
MDKTIKKTKLQYPTTNKAQKNNKKNGLTNIKFVKLKKQVIKKKILKKKKTSKKIVKKTPPIKKRLNKKLKTKKIKTINLPKQVKQMDLKKFFTIQKQDKKTKQIEDKNSTNNIKEHIEIKKIKALDKLTQSYIKLYGEQYFAFSKNQKSYIKNNISLIGKITQRFLKYPNISIRTQQSGINVVEFVLMPNGDIKDLKLIDSSSYTALDQNSINTIMISYQDYPKPIEPTKIKIYITYILN